jgi:uncharacterized protein (DUF885 family)
MTTQAPALSAWLDDFFKSYYSRRPVNATFTGVHDYDALLPDFSEHGAADTLAEMQGLLDRLEKLPVEPMTFAEKTDRRLAAGFLRIQSWEYQSHHFHRGNPCTYTGEAVFSVISLFLTDFAPASQRVNAAIERMNAIPRLLLQGQNNLREAPLAWTERALRECTGALAFFNGGIDRLIADLKVSDLAFRQAADRAVHAFKGFQSYLENDLRAHATQNFACGAEAFDLMLKQGHALTMSGEEIVRYAEEKANEAEEYLNIHAADFGAASWREALAGLAGVHPTAEGYYARYSELWNACKATAEEQQLVTWPDFPIRYTTVPEWAKEAAPYLYFLPYRSPAAFNRPAVHLYLAPALDPNLSAADAEKKLRAVNDSVIKLNHVVHHGSIGHHIQNYNAYRAESRIGQVAAIDCAARTGMLCAGTMCEGWACYTTEMMGETGYLTPLEAYSEYQSRLRMCARAVVDVRLHQGQFSLADAAEYYMKHAGMSAEASMGEAVKNSMFPGGAMMYLTGTDRIHALRKEMASREGSQFSLRRFHDRLLSYGSIPVSLISEDMCAHGPDAQ